MAKEFNIFKRECREGREGRDKADEKDKARLARYGEAVFARASR